MEYVVEWNGTLRAVGPGSGVLRGARLPMRLVALHEQLGVLDSPMVMTARHVPKQNINGDNSDDNGGDSDNSDNDNDSGDGDSGGDNGDDNSDVSSNADVSWQNYDVVFLPWDDMLRERTDAMSKGQTRVLDFAYEYLGMGHVRVHFVDTATGFAHTRRDGGSNAHERENNYQKMLELSPGDVPRSQLLSEIIVY